MKIEWNKIEVNGRSSVEFLTKRLPGEKCNSSYCKFENGSNIIGGVIRRGEWAWQAHGYTLEIYSLRNGHSLRKQEFGFNNGCAIKSVTEVCSAKFEEGALLAVSLVNYCSSGGESFLVLYSVEQGTVVSCLQLQGHISTVSFMRPNVCRRSLLQNFDGCLAVGNDEGVVVLLDLSVHNLLTQHDQYDVAPKSCQIIKYNLPLTDIHRHFQQSQQQGVHFGLQMEVIESPCSVQSMLPIDLILGLAIGLEDGRLAFYDLTELQIFYIAMPHSQLQMSPLVKMNYLEPPDDPRPCLYLWAMHEDDSNLTAVMHSLTYERRIIEMGTKCFFETFQNSSVRLQLPLESDSGKGVAIGCQAIMKVTTHGEDDSHCLCALSWYAQAEKRSKLLIFDLNQWYKEEMPSSLNWQNTNNYLAGFIPNGRHCALHIELNPCTIAHFNSMQRFEEHFYPNSLSFDCLILLPEGSRCHNWEGTQNRVIAMLRASSASLFLEPDKYFNEILRIHLVPQFLDLNINSTFSINVKYEILLSTALENNCFSLLRDCAKCWGDGSFTSNIGAPTSLSLETLTDWIWKRATHLTSSCNNLCKGLFDFGGYPLDQREQKELGFITRQLKMLSDLLGEVLGYSKPELSAETVSILEFRHQTLRMAADYQAILLWLVNIGLLPEASPSCNINSNLVPYPYAQLKTVYAKKREFFATVNANFVSKKTGSCSLIFIDAFIEHEFKGDMVREYWLENNGDGLYPPTSIEAMLRVMLIPDVGFDSKCAILLYFFLDLHMSIDELVYKNVVNNFIKFPSVFKLSASLIKTVQSFWNLDHGHFLPAVDEFISPFNNNQTYQEWLLELLIETLLTQNGANLALRILEARPMIVPPELKLKTLLANELISEAFHFARSGQNDSLLEIFFSRCLDTGKICDIRDLALNEREQELVQSLLKRSKTQSAENMHFVYLLQKSKYIDAILFMNELSKTRCIRPWLGNENDDEVGTSVDTPNLVLSAFNTTMAPVTLGLSDVYFRIRNKIKQKVINASPVPLSCQLIKQNANNLLGGMYHSSALGAHFATYYWGNMENSKQNGISLLSSENAPFLRKPQNESNCLALVDGNPISYPQTYTGGEKRKLTERDRYDNDIQADTRNVANPKKRRRMLGQLLFNNHSHSMNQIQQTSKLLSISSEQQQQAKFANALNILTEPSIKLTKRSWVDEGAGDDTRPFPIVNGAGINGILKTYTPEPMHCNTLCRDTTVDEEKNLRFKLPDFREVSVEIENDVYKHVLLSNNKQKVFAQSISVKSNSNELESEENFYSPHSSTTPTVLKSGVDVMTPEASMNHIRGPHPRKSLALFSSYNLEKSLIPESECKFDQITLEEPLKSSEPVAVIPMPQVSSATFLPSRISEFVPIVSSSRIRETNSKFILKTMTYHNKLTDGSTVFGDLTYDEAKSRTNEAHTRPVSTPIAVTSTQKEPQFFDTTLGMSSYDLAVLDTSGQASISSALQNNNSVAAESFEDIFDKQAVNNVNNSDDVCNNNEEVRETEKSCIDDNVLVFDVTSSCSNCFSVDLKPSNCIKKHSEYMRNHEDEAVTVLTTTYSESSRSYVGNEDDSRHDGLQYSKVKKKKDTKEKEELTSLELSIEEEPAEENTEGSKSDYTKVQDLKYQREDNISKQYSNVADSVDAENSLKTSSAAVRNLIHNKNNHSGNIYIGNLAQRFTQYSDNNELSQLKHERLQMISAEEIVRNEDHVVQKNCVSAKMNRSSFNVSCASVGKRVIKSYDLLKTEAHGKPADDGYNATYINNKDMETDYDIELGLDEDKLRVKMDLTNDKVNSKEMDTFAGRFKSGQFSNRLSLNWDKEDTHKKNCKQDSFDDHFYRSNANESCFELNLERAVYDYSLFESKSEENQKDNNINVENASSSYEKKEGKSESLEQNDITQFTTFKQNKDNQTSSEINQVIQVIDVSEICNRKLSDPISQDKELIENKEFELKEHWTTHTIDVTDEINITVDARNKMPENTCKSTKSKVKNSSSKSRPQMIAAFKDSETDVSTKLTPKTRRMLRGTSVPPLLLETNVESISTPRKRSMRGISVPPQTTDNEDTQPLDAVRMEKAVLDQAMSSSAETTPCSHRVSSRRSIATGIVQDNDDSMSQNSTTSVKKSVILLVPINKEAVTLDSPSGRTRSRLRLNSIDSELDAPNVSGDQTESKRARRITAISNVSEELFTPLRARRNSNTSQFESLDSQERVGISRNSSVAVKDPNLPNTEISYEKSEIEVSPLHTSVTTSDTAAYSLSRRLTRTQLAVMKKSATVAAMAKVDSSPISVKRPSRPLTLTYPESDDNESMSSNISGFSKSAVNRRITRSSVKDTAESDDDSISVVSSGSERRSKRHSKEKTSPNTILAAIPEDESEVQDVPRNRGKSRKH